MTASSATPRDRVPTPVREAGWPAGLAEFALACLAVAGVCLQAWLWGEYTGDDINTLGPVARHSLMGTIAYYIRPLEYFVVEGANRVWLPLWLVASGLAAVGAAWIHVRSAELVVGRRLDRTVRFAIIVGSPLWFYTVSQIDTVSESLCNLAFAAALRCLVCILFAPQQRDRERWFIALNVLASLLLYTKELAIGAACVLPAIGLWLYLRANRRGIAYAASALLFALSLAGWVALKIAFRSQMPEAADHYNLSPSLLDIARNTVATLAFGVTPLPTSLLSMSRLSLVWTACGALSALIALWAGSRLDWRSPAVRWLGLAMLGTWAPMFYVHASELYATMFGTLLVAILIVELRLPKPAALTYCAALLACSYLNAVVYYQGERRLPPEIGRVPYSVYFGPNGQSFVKPAGALACPIARTATVSVDCALLVCQDASGAVLQTFQPHGWRCTGGAGKR